MTRGLAVEHPGEVTAHHEARHGDVPAEVVVVARDDADMGPPEPLDQGAQDPGAVGRSDDRDGGPPARPYAQELVAGGADRPVGLVVGVGRTGDVGVGRPEEAAALALEAGWPGDVRPAGRTGGGPAGAPPPPRGGG